MTDDTTNAAASPLIQSTGSRLDVPQWFELLEISRDCANAPHLKNLLVWQDLEDGYDDAVAAVAYTLGNGKWKQCPDGEDCIGTVIAWAPIPKVSTPENRVLEGTAKHEKP